MAGTVISMNMDLWYVLLFALAGMCCALMSDIYYSILHPQPKIMEILLDFLFCLVCCAVLFVVTVGVIQDNLRGYMIVAFGASAFLWEKTGGRLLRQFLAFLKHKWMAVLHCGRSVCSRVLGKCVVVSKRLVCKKIKKDAKKTSLFSNNRVQ